jgi:hypothetical protein
MVITPQLEVDMLCEDVSAATARLVHERSGREPAAVQTVLDGDVVAVLVRESFRARVADRLELRRALCEEIQRVSSRRVVGFLTEHARDAAVGVYVFVLAATSAA